MNGESRPNETAINTKRKRILRFSALFAVIYLITFWGLDFGVKEDCALDTQLECGGFKCDILPSNEYYLGRVYVEEGRIQLPKFLWRGYSWKEQLVEDDFGDHFSDKQPSVVSGERFTKSTGRAAEIAARALGLIGSGEDVQGAAEKSRDIGITREISEHKVYSLEDSDMDAIHDWFKDEYMKTPSYLRRENDTFATKYYTLREIRVTKKMIYRISRDLVASIGGEAKLKSLPSVNFTRSASDSTTYEGQQEFSTELTVCYKAERLNEH